VDAGGMIIRKGKVPPCSAMILTLEMISNEIESKDCILKISDFQPLLSYAPFVDIQKSCALYKLKKMITFFIYLTNKLFNMRNIIFY